MPKTFSDRHGCRLPEREITIREDAPPELRQAIIPLAHRSGLRSYEIRNIVCDILLTTPLPGNWPDAEYDYENDPPEIIDETTNHLHRCEWPKIYDIVEALYDYMRDNEKDHSAFSDELNRLFRERGIGWELVAGKVQYRGLDSFGHATREAANVLQDAGKPHAAKEISEAIQDISRRPTPDITGAVQHAMAALESTARDFTGKHNQTLGQLVPNLKLKAPLDKAITYLWGYASNEARHGSENSNLTALDAELIVVISCALCAFLAKSAC